MAFPAVVGADTTTGLQDTATLSHPITLPANRSNGNRLLLLLASNTTATFSGLPGGWTILVNQTLVTATRRIYIAEKIIAGGEVDFTLTASATSRTRYRCFRITGAHASTAGEAAHVTATSANPDPPNLDPAGWAAEDTLWFAVELHTNGATLASAGPANYTNFQNENVTGTGGVGFSHARREVNASAENPGTFTIAASREYRAATIAIRPAPAGTVHQGASTIAGTSNVASAGKRVAIGNATLSGTSSAALAGKRVALSATSIAGTSSLEGNGRAVARGAVQLAGTSALSSVGIRTQRGTLSVAGLSSVILAGRVVARASAQVAGTSSLVGAALRVQHGSLSVAGLSELEAAGRILLRGSLTLSGLSTLQAAGDVISPGGTVHQGSLSIAGLSTLGASGVGVRGAAASIAGLSALSAQGLRVALASTSILGVSSLELAGVRVALASAELEGISGVEVLASRIARASVLIEGTSSVVVVVALTHNRAPDVRLYVVSPSEAPSAYFTERVSVVGREEREYAFQGAERRS